MSSPQRRRELAAQYERQQEEQRKWETERATRTTWLKIFEATSIDDDVKQVLHELLERLEKLEAAATRI